MKLPRLPKMPKLSFSRPKKLPPKKLEARVRSAAPQYDDYDSEEPQTKLSSAFIVVLILHVVAVGGIYAFNSIKASRRGQDPVIASSLPSPDGNVTEPTAAVTQPEQPSIATAAPTRASNPAPMAQLAPVSKQRVYHVKQGDTLTSIARQFGASISDLEAANGLKPGATLKIGQVLNVPTSGTAKVEPAATKPATVKKAATPATPQTYTVKSGDRLLFIAKRFNVSPDELIAANKIKDPSKLQIGQSLKIPSKRGH